MPNQPTEQKRRGLIRWKKRNKPLIKIGPRYIDPFGNLIFLKRALTSIIGLATYGRFNFKNNLKVNGAEHLMELPKSGVLFVSNHHTYYADVMALYHVFSSAKWKFKNIDLPVYLLMPRVRSYYIAAEETMKSSGWLPRVFSYAGAVTVRRSWRHKGQDVQRGADFRAPAKIKKALDYGWVITFPQGTTTHNAPVRNGAANLIKRLNPIVVPVKLEGFREAFDKRGLKFRKKGVELSVTFGAPQQFDESASVADVHQWLEDKLLDADVAT